MLFMRDKALTFEDTPANIKGYFRNPRKSPVARRQRFSLNPAGAPVD
jgi:hypothetical protein